MLFDENIYAISYAKPFKKTETATHIVRGIGGTNTLQRGAISGDGDAFHVHCGEDSSGAYRNLCAT